MSPKLDTIAIGKKAVSAANDIILDAGHILQIIDGDADIGIDGYIRVRKRVNRKTKGKGPSFQYIDTGNLIGVQIKGVTKIPKTGSHSYYVNIKDKAKFGINFKSADNLAKRKSVWSSFIGPVILIFVDLDTRAAWWTDLNNPKSYDAISDYQVIMEKSKIFNDKAFKEINKLGKEIFPKKQLITIKADNETFSHLDLSNFKESSKSLYKQFGPSGNLSTKTNPNLGKIIYSTSGWKHITRLNRKKSRILNSLLLLSISKKICEQVPFFTKAKKGQVRESERYIKNIEFLTLRANVSFDFRQSSIIQVILRRIKTFDKLQPHNHIDDKIYFHSVYEPFRNN